MSLNTGNLIEVIEDVEKSIHLLTRAGVATRLGQKDIERRP